MRRVLTSLFIVSLLCVGITWGQATEDEQAELARKTQNPVSDMISLPLQNNTTFDMAGSDSAQNVLDIQPVYPVKLNDDWNMITRTILPVISQPSVLTGGSGRENGLGDINATAFFSPASSGNRNDRALKVVSSTLPCSLISRTTVRVDHWTGVMSSVKK